MDPANMIQIYRKLKQHYSAQEADGVMEGETPSPDDADIRRLMRRLGYLKAPHGAETEARAVTELGIVVAEAMKEPIEQTLRLLKRHAVETCRKKPDCVRCPISADCTYARRPPSITELPADERPRERLLRYGADKLSDAELLGIIIRAGTPDATAVDIGKKLMAHFGGFRGIGNCSTADLCRFPGIGEAKAAQIKAALEIARRYSSEELTPGKKISSAEDVFRHFNERLRGEKRETFYVILLDQKHKIINTRPISVGTLNQSLVHPREVFSEAIRECAAKVIFVHNHPSGDPEPSEDDIAITRRLKEVGELVGIAVLDHIIIGADRYESLARRNLL